MTADGVLTGDPAALALLAVEGIRTVADILARSEGVRDLPDRSNHRLVAGGRTFHVKRRKSRRPSPEAAALLAAKAAGVPVPAVSFQGLDPREGSLVGTPDLSPARPMDDLIREGRLSGEALGAAFRSLAGAAASLHSARYHHHDLYLNHVYVDSAAAAPSVTLIDLERMTGHHGALSGAVVKDLAAIEASVPQGATTCKARARFLAHYLMARGFPVRLLLGPLMRRVIKKAEKIRAHVPRTPVGDAARPR